MMLLLNKIDYFAIINHKLRMYTSRHNQYIDNTHTDIPKLYATQATNEQYYKFE